MNVGICYDYEVKVANNDLKNKRLTLVAVHTRLRYGFCKSGKRSLNAYLEHVINDLADDRMTSQLPRWETIRAAIENRKHVSPWCFVFSAR